MKQKPHAVLARNREDARKLVQVAGYFKTRKLLEESQRDLEARLRAMPKDKTFTRVQLEAALRQVREVVRGLSPSMQEVIATTGKKAAEKSAEGTAEYLRAADEAFRGVGSTPLALNEARMLDVAVQGSRASLLRRLTSTGDLDDEGSPIQGDEGILRRYGSNTIGEFESILQRGIVARRTWEEMKADIVEASPFLQGKPAFWAERIVRTELMGMANRGAWEANREANEQLGDMVKILAATFDNRTCADSVAAHGQIRRPAEAFATWQGMMQHPPSRPNDREIIVPHRIAWPLPPYLKPRSRSEVLAHWAKEGRKGSPPGPLLMSTVDVELFGKQAPPKLARATAEGVAGDEEG